ncbi:radical SAM protein [Patescibacteria group bacterium]|nr:radical SAM protein [Patescibacteria group bacterium]
MASTNFEKASFFLLKNLPNNIRKFSIGIGTKIRFQKLKNYKTPINLTLFITSKCNARCLHCFYANQLNQNKPELELEDFKKIAKSLKHPLKTLMISGGEPFLRKDLAEICYNFIKYNKTKRISIDTNGILTEKIIEIVKTILEKNQKRVFHIQVSLDGPEKIHNKMRGVKNCYQKTLNTIKNLEKINKKYKNLELSIMTTICDLNFNHIESFCQDFAKLHPTVLHKFNIMRGAKIGTFGLKEEHTSNLNPNISLTKSPKELSFLFKKITEKLAKNKDILWQNFQKLKWDYMINTLKNKKKLLNCTAKYSFAVIYENGDVAICEPMKPIGNLKETGFNFEKLWNSEKAQKIKNLTNDCFCIHPCNLLDSMSFDKNVILNVTKKRD